MTRTIRSLRLIAHVFFRRIEVTGLEHVPASGGGILISWHPNAIVDAGLILTHFPRQVVFGARHGLFRWPLLGWVMRRIGTVPIYRGQDQAAGKLDAERQAANTQSLDALAQAVAEGSFAALFPEGISHDEPYPRELKTGAARLYYRARQFTPKGKPCPVILPVGLHYDKKTVFGSNALLAFHPPMQLDSALGTPPPASASYQEARKKYRLLTSELERALHDVVHATESWELHHLLHRGRKLVRAERAHRAGTRLDRPDMEERQLGFARLWNGYRMLRQTHPQKVEQLFASVKDYDRDLRTLGLQDHELDGVPHFRAVWVAGILLFQWILAYLLLPPLLIVGYVANIPTALFVATASRAASRANKDAASVKLIVGAVAFPLTWLAIGVLVGSRVPALHTIYPSIPNARFLTGLVAFALSAVGGVVAVHYMRLARQTFRSFTVTLTKARRADAIQRLRSQRSELYEALIALGEGLDLPGMAAVDGRVHSLN